MSDTSAQLKASLTNHERHLKLGVTFSPACRTCRINRLHASWAEDDQKRAQRRAAREEHQEAAS